MCVRGIKRNGVIKELPLAPEAFTNCQPVYDELPGWKEGISQMTRYEDLPVNAKRYVEYIVGKTKVNISMVSVGSCRKQTIHLINQTKRRFFAVDLRPFPQSFSETLCLKWSENGYSFL